MKVNELLKGIQYEIIQQGEYYEITKLRTNSAKIQKEETFIALMGKVQDGHDYVDQAVSQGASILILNSVQGKTREYPEYVTVIGVEDTRSVLSEIVNHFYHDPSSKFTLVGVTGTNGKTSVTTMANHVLRRIGYNTGLIGTIDVFINDNRVDFERTNPTTPDCIELGDIMDQCVQNKVDCVLMEVSSMALKMGRVQGCDFDIAVFNNISPEHLDDHVTMDDYKASKLKLFPLAPKAVVNVDDDFSQEVLKECSGDVIRFGINNIENCDLYTKDIEFYSDRVEWCLRWRNQDYNLSIKIPSMFAIYNSLAVIGICISMGVEIKKILKFIKEDIYIAGRYEVINRNNITVIIDFAHTPVALENLLKTVRLNKSFKRVISVFGCGGDRDTSKRSVMGNISQRYADFTVVTSDNPRTESPEKIINDIISGMEEAEDFCIEADRPMAIYEAIQLAEAGDVVVIAGKGHEKVQILNGYTVEMDDKVLAVEALERVIT